MIHFWNAIIRPVLELARPATIVEVGCAQGWNTLNLLSYVQSVPQGRLIAVDPSPLFDVGALQQQFGSAFVMIPDFSLNVLPQMGPCDAALLDGDHNWYTVYHELKALERHGRYPIVFLHDVEWPYGRRDMYYFPESVPEAYRKPSARKGMLPGVNELVEGGHNSSVHNAEYEYGERNGVLTAVEDFLRDTKLRLRLHRARSQHGLGIIVPDESGADHHLNEAIHHIVAASGL
ncbi:class I SAM-dependent methyltransferase [Paenibacillus dendritiformis]|uniref:class I SAM-dependent methyltransferase n=1 Tax=Paenibacillus dendritiformis TaxID=130049 RepID=UPI00248CA7C6|nr:class I SAM-dependent methyltransferase [Paenibacillus dendritiformis]WGU94544.1 class I SAM-dependent methyltransferase [Paenibacillus dendritiformis]